MSVDKMIVDKMTVDKMTVDEVTVDKITVDKMTVDEVTVDKMLCCHFKSSFFRQKTFILTFLGPEQPNSTTSTYVKLFS